MVGYRGPLAIAETATSFLPVVLTLFQDVQAARYLEYQLRPIDFARIISNTSYVNWPITILSSRRMCREQFQRKFNFSTYHGATNSTKTMLHPYVSVELFRISTVICFAFRYLGVFKTEENIAVEEAARDKINYRSPVTERRSRSPWD